MSSGANGDLGLAPGAAEATPNLTDRTSEFITPEVEPEFGVAAINTAFGTWSQLAQAPVMATHVALLRNNKILVVGGSQSSCCYYWSSQKTYLYDIPTGLWTELNGPYHYR